MTETFPSPLVIRRGHLCQDKDQLAVRISNSLPENGSHCEPNRMFFNLRDPTDREGSVSDRDVAIFAARWAPTAEIAPAVGLLGF
ncbi:hypothetical protein HPP92_019759 [Vanilla planifolia]|uniref:Uncharacterized protein n=1 Tax=Vanilla planifolia TaxID=51239 RepID=A0A835UK51_VANPL|nr:hypothetical protein HPP92_019759 [Vanilla planifolia]